jgi:hypothetical protein
VKEYSRKENEEGMNEKSSVEEADEEMMHSLVLVR